MSCPFPGMRVASIKRISPPTGVQAKPMAMPISLIFSAVSEMNFGCPKYSGSSLSSITSASPFTPCVLTIEDKELPEYLGQPKFISETAEKIKEIGIAMGLAWTPVGGEILFIEATRMPGKGQLMLTGSLGDVMKESAQMALS